MFSLVRVDNRLIHGQVVEAWLPFLKVDRVVVADDEAASSPLIRAAMGLAVNPNVEVIIQPLSALDFGALERDSRKTLLLIRDIGGVVEAASRGLPLSRLNLGNVHFATGRKQLNSSVFLSPEELSQLKMLAEQGVQVEARAVPSERALSFEEIRAKLQ
ncbi:MAG: PTS sugar transporter subunit IIB [Myxococcaceae bacterium]